MLKMTNMKDIWRESMARYSEKLGRPGEASRFRSGHYDYSYEDSSSTLAIAVQLIKEGWEQPTKVDDWTADRWRNDISDSENDLRYLKYIASCLPDNFTMGDLK